MRPRKYFVIPKASLERLLDDVEQLINFFVIEFQRVVFAENVYVTIAVSLLELGFPDGKSVIPHVSLFERLTIVYR